MSNRFLNVLKPAVRPLFTASDTFNIWKDAASRDLQNKVRQVLHINCFTVNCVTGVCPGCVPMESLVCECIHTVTLTVSSCP